jgi:hypothetical protein
MIPMAHCVHRTATRTRIRIPSKKGDKSFFAALREHLERCEQITQAEVNPLTGGVLIFHEGDFDAIAQYAERLNIFTMSEMRRNPTVMSATVATYRRLDSRLKRLSGGELDLPITAFLALAGVGVYKIAQGKFAAPAWYTAFWYALNIFLKAREKSSSKSLL